MAHPTIARILAVTAVATSFGCGRETPEDIAVTRAALSVCEESVPADRNVDGIPAYAQCDASESAAIYSNNGVDTSTEKVGAEWVRTQWSGGYQCTEFAHRYLYFKWDIDWLPNGNAGEWCNDTPPADSGMVHSDTPVHGDLMVLAPGSCGASPSTGHVVVIDVVGTGGQLTVVEQNGARRGRYMESCAACFIHVVANTGEGGASGIGGMGGAGGMGGSGGSGGSGGMGGSGGGAAPIAGVGGMGGAGGSAAPSGGAGGIGGSGGSAAPSGGAGGVGGASGMMSTPPIAGMAAGTDPAAPTGGALAMPMPRDTSAPEDCSVAHVGARPRAMPWSTLGILLAGLLVIRRRKSS
jgi:hypothetical protein